MFGKKNKLPPKDEGQSPAAANAGMNAEGTQEEPLPPDGNLTAPAVPTAKRKKKLPEGDDGRTIAEMNVEGMPWYNPTMGKVKEEDKPTRKEKRAMMRAGYLAYLPAFLIALLGFTAAALIIYLWLHGWTF